MEPKSDTPDDSGARPAGRVRRDAQGNAVWEWVSADTTSRLLRRLDVPGLQLQDEEPDESFEDVAPARLKGQGFDPYAGHGASDPGARRVERRIQIRKPSFLARLFGRR